MGVLDERPDELEILLSRRAAALGQDFTGPFKVLSVSRSGTDAIRCEVTACRLVPVDPQDPALRDVSIPLPVSGWIELHSDGSVAASSMAEPGPSELQEARIFARDLIEQGMLLGLSKRPPRPARGRPTHELQTDATGRRVIRRIGYSLR